LKCLGFISALRLITETFLPDLALFYGTGKAPLISSCMALWINAGSRCRICLLIFEFVIAGTEILCFLLDREALSNPELIVGFFFEDAMFEAGINSLCRFLEFCYFSGLFLPIL